MVEENRGVAENTNVAPPLLAVGVTEGELEEEMTKSLATAVVAPRTPDTLIMQLIAEPVR